MVLSTDILVMSILLLLSGIFSAAEIALISLSLSKMRQLVAENKPGAEHIKQLKEDPQRMLATILICNTLVNTGASAFATALAIRAFDSYALGIATGITTFLILIFGEIVPKTIAASHNEGMARTLAPLIWVLSVLLSPILFVIDFFMGKLMKLLRLKAKPTTISEEEIKSLIQAAEEEGSIKEIEKKMLHNIFEIDDTTVKEIMTPRTDVGQLDSSVSIEKAVQWIIKKQFSRVPVYEKTHDNIVGTIYVKELIPYLGTKKANQTISKVMKKPYFIPESKRISSLLRQFQKRKEHMPIVVDEHGSVTGIVTLEDILEEIVGEIMDETDTEGPNATQIDKKTWLVQGRAEIDEVNDLLKMGIVRDNYDTFSGFVMKKMGKIPKENEDFEYKKFKITVLEVINNRISKAKVEKK